MKANKNHICDHCQGTIEKGEEYKFKKARMPVLDKHDIQVGIEYLQSRYCLDTIACNKRWREKWE
jgi:hypothetical protein